MPTLLGYRCFPLMLVLSPGLAKKVGCADQCWLWLMMNVDG